MDIYPVDIPYILLLILFVIRLLGCLFLQQTLVLAQQNKQYIKFNEMPTTMLSKFTANLDTLIWLLSNLNGAVKLLIFIVHQKSVNLIRQSVYLLQPSVFV